MNQRGGHRAGEGACRAAVLRFGDITLTGAGFAWHRHLRASLHAFEVPAQGAGHSRRRCRAKPALWNTPSATTRSKWRAYIKKRSTSKTRRRPSLKLNRMPAARFHLGAGGFILGAGRAASHGCAILPNASCIKSHANRTTARGGSSMSRQAHILSFDDVKRGGSRYRTSTSRSGGALAGRSCVRASVPSQAPRRQTRLCCLSFRGRVCAAVFRGSLPASAQQRRGASRAARKRSETDCRAASFLSRFRARAR